MLQPQIILLREGTDTSQGKAQLISNINACSAIVDTVRTTLGPRGMDKLIQNGNKVIISNDGATILKHLDIVHPAAQTLVEIAKSQDEEVGDGTTSVVVIAGELLKESKQFIEEGIHPTVLIRGLRRSCALAKQKINELAVTLNTADQAERRRMLIKCASTALNSKLVASHKEMFSRMVVDAVLSLDADLDLGMIGMKKEGGGALEESQLVEGVAFKKTFSYAGFEQQPKRFENPRIALLNLELELKAEKENADVRIENPRDYQAMVDAEWEIIYEKLARIVAAGAKVVLSRLAIGDLATQYFADRDVFCAGRVPEEDLRRVARATGAQVQTSVADLAAGHLGTCALFEERQVGAERYNFFSGCRQARAATILLRGGGEQFNDEAERSLHDAIMIVRRALRHERIVAGGGAAEMQVSRALREHSRAIAGKQQAIVNAFARALEVVPRQLAINAGFDSIHLLNMLRQKHATAPAGRPCWFGVDIVNDTIADTFETGVWEPALVKLNALQAATEAACLILSVDETVRNPKSDANLAGENAPAPAPRGMMPGMRGGRGGMRRGR